MGQVQKQGIHRQDPEYGSIHIQGKRALIHEPFSQVKWDYLIQRRPQPHLIDVYFKRVIESGIMCSTKLIEYEVDYFEECLDWYMTQRKKFGHFSEAELWYIAKFICKAQNYIDLHPYNIRLDSEGRLKLLDLDLLPNNMSNLQKVNQSLRDFEYLSPEQLHHEQVSIQQSNAFILGVILLVCVSEINIQVLYDIHNLSFNTDIAFQKLDDTFMQRPKLSNCLKQTIESLLIIDPKIRLSFQELQQLINRMDHKIANHLSHRSEYLELSLIKRINEDNHIQQVINLGNKDQQKDRGSLSTDLGIPTKSTINPNSNRYKFLFEYYDNY